MDKKRYKELMSAKPNTTLTKEEFKEGWHFCPEWDLLLINKYTDREGEACICILDKFSCASGTIHFEKK